MTVGAEEPSATISRLPSGGIATTWLFVVSSTLLSAYVCIPTINALFNRLLKLALLNQVEISGSPFVLVYIIVLISAYCGIASRDGDNKDAIVKSRWVVASLVVAFAAAYALTAYQSVLVFSIGMLFLPTVGVSCIPKHARSPWTQFIAVGTVFSTFITLGYSIFRFSESVLSPKFLDFIFVIRLTFFIVASFWLFVRITTKTIHEYRESGLRRESDNLESSSPIFRIFNGLVDLAIHFAHSIPGWWEIFWRVLKSEVGDFFNAKIWGRLWKFLISLVVILFVASLLPFALDSLVQHLQTDYFVGEFSLFPLFTLTVYVLAGVFVAVGCRWLLDVKFEIRKDFAHRIGDPILALALVAFAIGCVGKLAHFLGLEMMGFAGWPVATLILLSIFIIMVVKRFISTSGRYRKISSQ